MTTLLYCCLGNFLVLDWVTRCVKSFTSPLSVSIMKITLHPWDVIEFVPPPPKCHFDPIISNGRCYNISSF